VKVLVTGHDGYIGHALVPLFQEAGHEVVGMDSGLFDVCDFGSPTLNLREIKKDVRDQQ
jgi:nucleoside-diphosphate-sugar epimerase